MLPSKVPTMHPQPEGAPKFCLYRPRAGGGFGDPLCARIPGAGARRFRYGLLRRMCALDDLRRRAYSSTGRLSANRKTARCVPTMIRHADPTLMDGASRGCRLNASPRVEPTSDRDAHDICELARKVASSGSPSNDGGSVMLIIATLARSSYRNLLSFSSAYVRGCRGPSRSCLPRVSRWTAQAPGI